MAPQNINQFGMTIIVGQPDLRQNFNTISAQIDSTSAVSGGLKPGNFVKLVDSVGGIPKVVECADSDTAWGVIVYNPKDSAYLPGDKCEISAFHGNVQYMQATAAIARGVRLKMVNATVGGVASATTGDKPVGIALDKATASGQLIRVYITLPNFTAI